MNSILSKIILAIIVIGSLLVSILISNYMVTFNVKTPLSSTKLVKTETYTTPSMKNVSTETPIHHIKPIRKPTLAIKRFKSYTELELFINRSIQEYTQYGRYVTVYMPYIMGAVGEISIPYNVFPYPIPAVAKLTLEKGILYSKTNIQVLGVDEADIVKTDGKYIYLAVLNKVFIIKAYPPEEARIISKIDVKYSIEGLYVKDNRLVVITSKTITRGKIRIITAPPSKIIPRITYYTINTTILIYNITNRERPVVVKNITITGRYITSRMIGKYIYIILSNPLGYKGRLLLPLVNNSPIPPYKIGYFSEDISYSFTIILAINIETGEYNEEVFLTGTASNIYVSKNNLYILSRKHIRPREVTLKLIKGLMEILPADIRDRISKSVDRLNITVYKKYKIIMDNLTEWYNKQPKSIRDELYRKITKISFIVMTETYEQETVIYRFKLSGLNITAEAKGAVPGFVLDQFSMDEYKGYFRIATTKTIYNITDGVFRSITVNNIYVLNMSLTITGKLENLAPGERIYAARYMGDIAFLITYRKVDPLYGIDLSNPYNPKVIGFLKIPGYSEYLHPYRDRYLIGLGYNTDEEGRIIGLKIALFDILNASDIREVSVITIDKRGLSSPVFSDHKAFLMREDKGYFAFPVRGVENGVYVVEIVNESLKVKGLIVHQFAVRTLYIGDYIYTIAKSPCLVKILTDDTLELIKEIIISREH